MFADTLRRDVFRDYSNIHRHPIPVYSPVYWADAGEVYVFLPVWRLWDHEEERYEVVMPKASHIFGRKGHIYVRMFPTLEEAAAFLGQENASPLRMHLVSGSYSGLLRAISFGQLGNGGSIMSSRDDGWDLRDSEGWHRYGHCRPITIRELLIPRRDMLCRVAR